jgi:hypothetical protein
VGFVSGGVCVTDANSAADLSVSNKYIAFCDVLGFSAAVESDFQKTLDVYRDFRKAVLKSPYPEKISISVYSDSILIVCDELPPVLYAVQQLWFDALLHDWLIRGAIAFGKYWEDRSDGNLCVVSDALVRAVRMEATVKHPGVFLSPEVEVPLAAGVARFRDGVFKAPLLHFQGRSLVNPFNPYWFASAIFRISQLREKFPQHEEKYAWFLNLAQQVANDELLVPEAILDELIRLEIIKKN